MGANCNATPPLLKAIFFRLQIWLDQLWPPRQNFMGAICHITPVLNDILDLCQFDLMYLTPPPPKFHRCILSCYTCVNWYFRSMQIWPDVFDPPCQNFMDAFHHITPQPFNQSASSHSRHNKNHVLPKRSTMLKSISCFSFSSFHFFSIACFMYRLGVWHHVRFPFRAGKSVAFLFFQP